MHNLEILIPITMFAVCFGVLYVFFMTRNRERLAMIEKGIDITFNRPKPNRYLALKAGMFLVGVAVGVLFGNILEAYTKLEEGTCYVSMIALFGGISLLLGVLFG